MGKRTYPDRPILSVGCVVLRGDDVLLIRRGREPMKGRWSIPGGVMEVGETVLQAAVREVMEETGIAAEAVANVDMVEAITRDAEGAVRWHFCIMEVAARWISGEPVAGDDADAAVWASPEALSAHDLTPRTLEVIARARAAVG